MEKLQLRKCIFSLRGFYFSFSLDNDNNDSDGKATSAGTANSSSSSSRIEAIAIDKGFQILCPCIQSLLLRLLIAVVVVVVCSCCCHTRWNIFCCVCKGFFLCLFTENKNLLIKMKQVPRKSAYSCRYWKELWKNWKMILKKMC